MAFFRIHGDLSNTRFFLSRNRRLAMVKETLERYGQKGVDLLREATPVRTGKTAASWSYEVENNRGVYTLSFNNSNVNDHVNIAIILDTGHGTGSGAYVRGIEYIEPSLQPVLKALADSVWKEVTR